jgi:hypothetical protein
MAPVLTTASQAQCPHGGTATLVTTQTKLMVAGNPVLLETDQHVIAGCAFVVATVPSPCVLIQWSGAAQKLKVNGAGVLLATSVGQSVNAAQAPQGVVIVSGPAPALDAI